MSAIDRTPTPDMTHRAMVILDSLRYGHSREDAIRAVSTALVSAWNNGYSSGEGDILAAEAENAYRQFGEVMRAVTER